MSEQRRYFRFPIAQRIEHWLLVLSFALLALTGLAQKFATYGIAQAVIAAMGGIETVRIIHRAAAVLLMLEALYHIGVLTYRLFVLHERPSIVPSLADMKAGWQALLYNLRLGKRRPQEGRYTFAEKFEYWALIWGTVVMGITGFMLWNPIATTGLLPGEAIPAAKAAHGGEALLAVLAVIVWHLYHVHLRSFNRSMFNGYLSEHQMLEEHPLELADIKAGIVQPVPDPRTLARRRRIFLPVFSILALGALAGITAFAIGEQTALETVPPAEQVTVFAPSTPTPSPSPMPTSTPPSLAASTWQGGIASLLQAKCAACHSSATKLGGLDLSSYQALLSGGTTGPAMVPGDPGASPIIVRQSSGDHPGQLSGEELAVLRSWIEAGAPQ